MQLWTSYWFLEVLITGGWECEALMQDGQSWECNSNQVSVINKSTISNNFGICFSNSELFSVQLCYSINK